MKPYVQVALDNISMEEALDTLANGVGEAVDIVEVGTLLLAAEGKRAISLIRRLYPNKIVVADFKLADAAATLTPMFLNSGADYATVIAAADPETMKIALDEAKKLGKMVQVELYGPWDRERAQMWRDIGMEHIIYHHSRDAGKPWDETDIQRVKLLADLGFNVTVTGGLDPSHIHLFKGIPIFCFIGGRSIRLAKDPAAEIARFQEEISKYF